MVSFNRFSFTIFTVSAPVSSAENGLSTAGWSLWGGAAGRMQFFRLFVCLFVFGGEGIYVDGLAAYRLAGWCGYWCVGTRHRF